MLSNSLIGSPLLCGVWSICDYSISSRHKAKDNLTLVICNELRIINYALAFSDESAPTVQAPHSEFLPSWQSGNEYTCFQVL